MGDATALTSDKIECTSDNSKRVKCDPNWAVWVSSSVGMEFAVVNQCPGSWDSRGVGKADMEDTNGVCRESDEHGVKLMCAIRKLVMLL